MTRLQVVIAASAASLAAIALLWRKIVALAAAIVFASNLPQQHRENVRAIADLTKAVKSLTDQVAAMRNDIARMRRR